jgi:uncharacterized membrane protein YbhN (UPF0104 family)
MRLSEITDMVSIPFFFALTLYFYGIEDKTPLEYVLFLFSIIGFFVDTILTLLLVRGHCRKACKSSINNSK